MTEEKLKTIIISDFTADPLAHLLNGSGGQVRFEAEVAPFGQVARILLDPADPVWQSRPDLAIVWTRPEEALPSFARGIAGERVDGEQILADVEAYGDLLRAAAPRCGALLAPTWSLPHHLRGAGTLAMQPWQGSAHLLMRASAHLAEILVDTPNIYLLDSAAWFATVGAKARNPKLWHMGKIAYSQELLSVATTDIIATALALSGQSRKLIVVDLDDTLWRGIVGDVGWEGLKIGGHDAIGEAYLDFQKALKRLKSNGIMLAILSKNEESTALTALREHPEMVLRPDDFVGWRIDWGDKAQNMAGLLNELNLLPHSVVFIDDNPAERARVKDALPDILVPDWPKDPMLATTALTGLSCFDVLKISDEDRRRTDSYVEEKRRTTARENVGSLNDWLASLDLRVTVELLDKSNLDRAVQLLNKTNQMNLRTRRMRADEAISWAEMDGNNFHVFRVTDRFGDYGLTGLASISRRDDAMEIEDFVLSCRVMGRGVEKAMLHVLVNDARGQTAREIRAVPIPSARNKPCLDYFKLDSGFTFESAGEAFVWDLNSPYPLPEYITV